MVCTILEMISFECPPMVYGRYFYANHEHTSEFRQHGAQLFLHWSVFMFYQHHMHAFQTSIVWSRYHEYTIFFNLKVLRGIFISLLRNVLLLFLLVKVIKQFILNIAQMNFHRAFCLGLFFVVCRSHYLVLSLFIALLTRGQQYQGVFWTHLNVFLSYFKR